MISTSKSLLSVRAFFLALFTDLARDKNYRKCFKASHKQLHEFFWKLTKDKKYIYFVQELLFDTNGNYPHSPKIDELLQEFQLSGVLSRPNPTYKYNDIAITHNPYAKEFYESLSSKQNDDYKEILDLFKKELGVPEDL